MPQINILVVEDEPLHLAKMNFALEQLNYKSITVTDCGEEALRLFKAVKPDLVMMDINIKGNKKGTEIAQEINNIEETPIIFTTSLSDSKTVKEAISTNPCAYLIKPIEKKELNVAIEMALFKLRDSIIENETMKKIEQGTLLKNSFFIKTLTSIEKINYKDVVWIESSEEKYLEIVTNDTRIKMRSSIKKLITKLNPDTFVQVNQSQIINVLKLKSISDVNSTVTVNSRVFSLGKLYKKELLQRIQMIN